MGYDDIVACEDPKSCCENCRGLCVNVYGIMRGMGTRSANCWHRVLILTYKSQQSIVLTTCGCCGKRGRILTYNKIAISVDANNYAALKQLLDRKCFFGDSGATTTI